MAYGSDGFVDNERGPWHTMIADYATSIATNGFVAIVPFYLDVTKAAPGLGVFELIATFRDRWQTLISDTIYHAQTLTNVGPGRVGLLGFSLGGHLCLRERSKAKVLVEYFAPVLDGVTAGSGKLQQAQIHHGNPEGPLVPYISNAPVIEKVLKDDGVPTALFPYPGANHGFVGSDTANSTARTQSKNATMTCFNTYL